MLTRMLTNQNEPFPGCARHVRERDVCKCVHALQDQLYGFPLTFYFDVILGL